MNLHAYVDAAFDVGNPAVQGNRQHWHDLADDDPASSEWYNLFKASLTAYPQDAAPSLQVEYTKVVKDVS